MCNFVIDGFNAIKLLQTINISNILINFNQYPENKLTIKMVRSRLSLNNYQIYIPTGAFKDAAGNKNSKYLSMFKTSKY